MTSAINGRIFFKQDTRNYLDANKRSNSLVFDLDNNILLYSPSGTDYYEFYPGQTSGGGGSVSAVSWNNVTGKPTASTSTSGILTSSDWNKFNNKADTSAIPSSANFVQIGSIVNASTNTSGYLTSSDWNKFNAKADLSAVSGGPSATSGDGGVQGIYLGTYANVSALPVSAIPGSFITTRDGKMYVFKDGV